MERYTNQERGMIVSVFFCETSELNMTVWCLRWMRQFFEKVASRTTTVNGERYRVILTEFLLPKLDELALENMWFQQILHVYFPTCKRFAICTGRKDRPI